MHMSPYPLAVVGPLAVDAEDRHERAVVKFVNLQMFVLIYLQKFALGSSGFQLSVPMLILLGSVAWGIVVSQTLSLSVPRLGIYLVFVACCLWSESLSGGSFTSILQLVLLYSSMAVYSSVSEASYRKIIGRFTTLMILPAYIVIVQYTYQKLTGLDDPINMNHLLPKTLLLQGFYYDAHFPWYSTFSRPNGFFFLEPSFVSAFTASAAILEILYFRRPYRVVLMLAATFLSMGATGASMLAIATPFLLVREKPQVWLMTAIAAISVVIVALTFDIPLPMMSRLDEVGHEGTSGGQRVLQPALYFVELASDPSYILAGDGAGAISALSFGEFNNLPMNPWPIVKLLNEYGLLAVISFVILYIVAIAGNFNVPLKVALSIEYLFTGGYLLSPAMVELLVILCFVVAPARQEAWLPYGLRTLIRRDAALIGSQRGRA
ncbi:MAG: hypothetical protein JO189_17190 [Deltaproteobacteria bacterium]|nr:hypothetical protein [Deltaproteobacteria bacterium]